MFGGVVAPQHPWQGSIADRSGHEAQQIRRCPAFASVAQGAAAA
jgi:hypothetical protein